MDQPTLATQIRPTWRQLLAAQRPLLLPCAHDGLSARLIERAGFSAYSIGGFPAVGSRYAIPDLGLISFGEMLAAFRDIISASRLPVMVDADDGYGDAKNVTRTVRAYETLGVSALFIEDQRAPKRCGHMAGKDVIATEAMVVKLRAAAAARDNPDTFLIARTDAAAVHGLDDAMRRGERYLAAGADGLFIEAPMSVAELERIGRSFSGAPLMANMLEGGRTPWLPPAELAQMGFAMVAYPTTLIFRVARTIERTLAAMLKGEASFPGDWVDFDEFKDITGFAAWVAIEERAER